MSNNIAALPSGKGKFSLTPQTLDEAMRFAELLAKSSIVPKDYQGNPGNVIVAVQWGAELGLPPLQAMQNIAVINGRPSIWGDAMLALVRGSGLLEYIREEVGEDKATCTIKRRGEEEVVRTFSVEDAKRAGLMGKQGPWQQYPRRMLQMRARAYALRDVFPDVLRGVYIAEEAQDMPPERDITAESERVKEQPKSRAEAVKAALADRRKEVVTVPPVTPPALDTVLTAISQAETLDALNATTKMAKALGEEERKRAREAFMARKAELGRQTIDHETGEVIDHAAPAGLTYAEVAGRLAKARTLDELDEAADLIASVADGRHADELAEEYQRRRAEMAGQ